MGRYVVHIDLLKGREIPGGAIVPNSYEYWEPLISYFINRSNNFRIDCWAGEEKAIQRAATFGEILETELKNMKVFTGKLTKEFINELINNPFDGDGKIQWFSIFLMNEDRFIFSLEHYGSELVFDSVSEEDVAYICSVMPEDFDIQVHDYVIE